MKTRSIYVPKELREKIPSWYENICSVSSPSQLSDDLSLMETCIVGEVHGFTDDYRHGCIRCYDISCDMYRARMQNDSKWFNELESGQRSV